MDEASKSIEVQNKELVYETPSVPRYLASAALDLFCTILFGFLFLLGGSLLLKSVPAYQNVAATQNSIRLESRLYAQKGEDLLSLSDYLSNAEQTRNEQIQIYSDRLSYFYTVYLEDYPSLNGTKRFEKAKAKATSNDQALFDGDGKRALLSADYDEAYLSFYSNLYANDALGCLAALPPYRATQQSLLRMRLTCIGLSFFLSSSIFYVIIPLSITRGKRSLGMLLSHIGYVDRTGLSPRWWIYLFMGLFRIVFILFASFITFLIPLAISLGMVVLRKDRQGLPEYLFGLYPVSCSRQRIYKNKFELPK